LASAGLRAKSYGKPESCGHNTTFAPE
jgi:hypothetical protein